MRRPLAAIAAICLTSATAVAQRPTAFTPLTNMLAPDAPVDEYSITADGNRVYYSTIKGEVWLFDRRLNKASRISEGGEIWDVSVAPNGSSVAYSRNAENGKDEYIWTIPLDPRTGLATGPQRRASMMPGDTPSISPDGRQLAFARIDSAGQSLVVLPVQGGPERVLGSFPAGIGHIEWTPDGKTIFFGLTAPNSNRTLPGSINRIPVSGGTPKLIAKAVGGPGLSPDGKFLVFHDTGFTRSFVVADTTGRRLSTFAPPRDMQVDWWTGKSTLVASKFTAPWRLRAHSLVDGTSRVVVDNLEQIGSPAWSNDGKQIAFSVVEGSRAAIAVMDPSGSSPRTVPVDVAFPDGISWSPDNRWMLFHNVRAPAAIAALEVTTGRQVVLSANNTVAYATWADDSRHAFIRSNAPSDQSRRAIRLLEADLTGGTRVLRELPTAAGQGFQLWPVDRNAALVTRGPDQPIMLEQFSGGQSIQILPAPKSFVAIPIVSRSHEWVAFRRNTQSNDNTKMTLIDVVKLDGSNRTTITLPFFASGGQTLQFLPGDKQLVVAEKTSTTHDAGVYLVTVATQQATKLFSLHTIGSRWPELALSPDGKTVLYTSRDSAPGSYATLDVSRLVAPKP